ncbi:serine hydrolase [Legionella shakespearei]|uniref:beta-lactamase n=1 Tax=Legionella shakespearei DSM 23087 TaxID=1122169 RepID=A0A0W0YKX7_9GAMM|nr:serine hydrolase [Legionella shakespearei]KTD57549.1 beta-lactamase [Legionella shakespearei DSM 23087]
MMTRTLFLRNIRMSGIKNCFFWALFCFLLSNQCLAGRGEADLAKKISAIEKKANVIIGITAVLIEKNKVMSHNGNKRFFMASTIKLPIAIAFLHRVDEKKDSLKRIIKLDYNNSVPGSGSLYHIFEKKKLNMSSQQIMNHMLINSDNSASDTLLDAVNGPQYVNKRMSALGFKNISVNRSILEMFMDTNDVDHSYLEKRRPVYSWKKILNSTPLSKKVLAWKRFEKDARDSTTPDDMANLLVKLYNGEALSESSTDLLIKTMEKCRTGRSRIKGLLPPNVKVAHKTGTWAIDEMDYLRYPGSKKLYRFASDVGIITLPHNKGHIALAIYVKSQSASDYPRSHSIALASKAVYDHFMKQ